MGLIINGEVVDDLALEEEFDAIKEHHERLGEVVCCDRDDEFRELAHENVVQRTLLRQEAIKRFGECGDGDIDQAIADLKEQHGGEKEFFENVGISEDDEDQIRGKVADTLLVNRVLEDEVGPDPTPSEDDLRSFYEAHVERYLSPEEIRVWHIFVEPQGPQEAQEAYETLRKTRRELREGGDFETKTRELCKEDHEMDMGFFSRGTMLAELETAIFSLENDEISPVIASPFGYHLFKLADRRGLEPIPFEEVREQVVEHYLTDLREKRIQTLMDRLRKDATIEETDEVPA